MPSTYQRGKEWEKKVKDLVEVGAYDTHVYHCELIPRTKYGKKDLFGADILCTNRLGWTLVQVKYRADRLPPLSKKTIKEMLQYKVPPTTKRVIARIDGRNKKVVWTEVG